MWVTRFKCFFVYFSTYVVLALNTLLQFVVMIRIAQMTEARFFCTNIASDLEQCVLTSVQQLAQYADLGIAS